jgi:hypothetical protein
VFQSYWVYELPVGRNRRFAPGIPAVLGPCDRGMASSWEHALSDRTPIYRLLRLQHAH